MRAVLLVLVTITSTVGCRGPGDGESRPPADSATLVEADVRADGSSNPDAAGQEVDASCAFPGDRECTPVDGGACPAGCTPRYGRRYDPDAKCFRPNQLAVCTKDTGWDKWEQCSYNMRLGVVFIVEGNALTCPAYADWRVCTDSEKSLEAVDCK